MAGGSNGSTTEVKRKRRGDSQRSVKLELPCELTAKEHAERSNRLAQLDIQIIAKTEEKRAANKLFNEAIKKLAEERDPLAVVVDAGKETRTVECVEEAVFERNTIVIRRRDTGEEIEQRPMESDERERMAQGRLPWDLPELPEEQVNDITEPPRPAA